MVRTERTLIFSLSSGFRHKITSTVLKQFCLYWAIIVRRDASERDSSEALTIREGTFFLGGGGLGPQRGGPSVKVSTKRGGPYLM